MVMMQEKSCGLKLRFSVLIKAEEISRNVFFLSKNLKYQNTTRIQKTCNTT